MKASSSRRLPKLVKAVASIGLAVGAMTTATAAPAAASDVSTSGCTHYFTFRHTQVQVDNCPGQGASWSWMWTAGGTDTLEADLYLTFSNGTKASDWAYPDTKGDSATWDQDVRSFHVCEKYNIGWFPPVTAHTCSTEAYMY